MKIKNIVALFALMVMTVFSQAQYPVSDSLTGSGVMGSNWTTSSVGNACVRTSSGATPSTGGSCIVTYTGQTFTPGHDQSAQIQSDASFGTFGATPLVRCDTSSNCYAWVTSDRQIYKLVGGSGVPLGGNSCPGVNANELYKITARGTTINCVNVTTGQSGPGVTDSTYATGNPGILVNTGTLASNFQADCFPSSCGTLSPPTFTPAGGTYGFLPSGLTIVPPVGFGTVSICYTINGSTPTATTPGTCGVGSTTYTGPITLPNPATTVVKAITTQAAGLSNSIVESSTYNIVGVSIQANSTLYGFPVLAGSVVQINDIITYGSTNLTNWSVGSQTGGATATLSATTNANGTIAVTVGPTSGTCSVHGRLANIYGAVTGGVITNAVIVDGGLFSPNVTFGISFADENGNSQQATATTDGTGAVVSVALLGGGSTGFLANTDSGRTVFPNPYTFQSTASFVVTAQAVDDLSRTATFNFPICENTTKVETLPFYATQYANQPLEITALTTGTSDPNANWTIVSQPSGGNGTLTDNDKITTLFNASVAGRYVVKACNRSESAKCSQTTVFVTGNAMPFQVTPNGTMPIDPTVDPALTGTVYNVGPTQTYSTFNAIDYRTLTPGSTVRVHNEGPNGSPTTFFEYAQISSQGSHDQPIRIVGVPNASGELPVFDAIGASGPSYQNIYIFGGIFNTWMQGCGGGYSGGSCGPFNIIIEGLRFQNARLPNQRVPPAGGALEGWAYDTAAVSLHSGYEIVVRGIDSYNNANGVATYAPVNPGWAAVTQWVHIAGNNIHQFGNLHGSTEHGVYAQSHGQVVELNNIHDPFTGDEGSGIKTRTDLGMIKYNAIRGSLAREIDEVEVQDDAAYFGLRPYFGRDYINRYSAPFGQGDTLGLAGITGFFEGSRKRFVVGNILDNDNATIYHCAGDHDSGGDTDCRGTIYFTNNTVLNATQVFDSLGSGGGAEGYFEFQRFNVQNNILDSTYAQIAIGRANTFLGSFGKNLVRTGTVNITPPIVGGNYNAGSAFGWGDLVPTLTPWQNYNPVDGHVTGISNIFFSAVKPVNATTYIPITGSQAIGTGAALTGLAAMVPPRLQFHPNLGYATTRVSPLDVGALDFDGTPPTVVSVALTPSPVSLFVGGAIQLTCTATLSDGGTRDCTGTAVFSAASAYFTVSSTGLVSGSNLGSGTVTATYLSVTSPSVTVNVGIVLPRVQGATMRNALIQ